MLKISRLAAAAGSLALSGLALAQSLDPVVARIIDEGKNRSQIMKTLRHLSLEIGPRLTGSPELLKAQKWAAEQFRRYGCKNVQLEYWGDVSVGFTKGKEQIGRMVAPVRRDFQFATQNWTEGTKGKVRGRAVMNPKTAEEVERMKAQLKGAWVIMDGVKTTMRGPQLNLEDPVVQAVNRYGIAGRVFGSANELVHAHGSFRGKTFEDRKNNGVNITVRASDFERIKTHMATGPVELEFKIDHRWIKGPVRQFNVVAEIPGTERPDEVVIVCGHLDTWNPVGSQGTSDNGTGSSVALEAARILAKVGARPKRTVRFILWSGEEQGLLGSLAYVDAHKGEMEKISAVINDDGGTGYHGGYTITKDMEPMMAAAIAPVQAAFPDLPMSLNVVDSFPQGMGSDHGPFLRHSVPAFFTHEGGDANYMYIWHTQNDRLENARPNYLVQSATEAAVVSYYLANAPTLLPRAKRAEPKEGESTGAQGGYFDHDHSHDE